MERDPTAVKFAECPCSASEEDWELLEERTTTDGEQGLSVATYECQTCGETQSTTTDVTVF